MIKWLKERTPQERWMLALIAMLLIGVAVRQAWIRSEAAEAFRERMEHFRAPDGEAGAGTEDVKPDTRVEGGSSESEPE